MKLIHTVGSLSLECDILESEAPPKLVEKDTKNVFINTYSCEYFLLREKIYEKLVEAKTYLPKGFHFKAFELYRPLKRQIYYWDCALKEMANKYPNLSQEELEVKANTYIANPYKQGSGHQSGAAVDLTVCDDNGQELDMGTLWREFNDLTATFSQSPLLTDEQKKNRMILYEAMIRAGFVNYFEEWWHYSFGDIEWAVITHVGKTLYAPLGL